MDSLIRSDEKSLFQVTHSGVRIREGAIHLTMIIILRGKPLHPFHPTLRLPCSSFSVSSSFKTIFLTSIGDTKQQASRGMECLHLLHLPACLSAFEIISVVGYFVGSKYNPPVRSSDFPSSHLKFHNEHLNLLFVQQFFGEQL